MKLSALISAFVISLVVCGLGFADETRDWTSIDGRIIKARFISATDSKVTIVRLSDGRRFSMPLANLSKDDRDWIMGRNAGIGAEPLPPDQIDGLEQIPEDADRIIRLPLRIHIISEIELEQKGVKMSTWVTQKDIENKIFPEINRIWKPAGIEWFIESIVEQTAVEIPERDLALTTIQESNRNSSAELDKARTDSIKAFCDKKNGHPAVNNLYFFPYVGQTYQGFAAYGGNYAIVGVWTDKPSKAARRPMKFIPVEKGAFEIGSIARTSAHELGHNLGLKHPDPETQTRFGRVMGGKRPGNEFTPEEIEMSREMAMKREEKIKTFTG